MQQSIQPSERASPQPTEPAPAPSRLRTVTGNCWPRKCACGCEQKIPRDPEICYVVDFGAPKPHPAYLREHSPDYPGRHAQEQKAHPGDTCPGFVSASLLVEQAKGTPDIAHADEESSPSPQSGRAWASGQLVFNAGQFESARSGFADYARDGETAQQLRTRVNRVILEDLEQKVVALRQLHEKLRHRLEGPSFGDVVARGRPIPRPG